METKDGDIREKLVIVMRHGERSDFAGQIPKLHKFDPELTDMGKKQAYEAGGMIRNYLKSINFKGKVSIISSPFARTIQTSIEVKRAFKEEDLIISNTENKSDNRSEIYSDNKSEISNTDTVETENISGNINQLQTNTIEYQNTIFIDNKICEYINDKFCGVNPIDFLSLYNNCKFFYGDIVKEELNGLNYLNSTDHLPNTRENNDKVIERVKLSLQNLVENFIQKGDSDALILVTHASPVNNLNMTMGYPGPHGWRHIKYCSSYCFKVNFMEGENKFTYTQNIVPTLSELK